MCLYDIFYITPVLNHFPFNFQLDQCPFFYCTPLYFHLLYSALHHSTLHFKLFNSTLLYCTLLYIWLFNIQVSLYFISLPCTFFICSPVQGWSTVGPPHKRKHLLYEQEAKNNGSNNEAVKTPGQLLEAVRTNVFHSSIFAKYLNMWVISCADIPVMFCWIFCIPMCVGDHNRAEQSRVEQG